MSNENTINVLQPTAPPVGSSEWFCRIVHESLLRRSEHWRTSQNDSHGINTAVYVALHEVANAINDAAIFAGQRQNSKVSDRRPN